MSVMLPLFGLMLAGYALGAALAVLSPGGRVARRLVAAGVVVGAGAGLALALAVLLTGAVFVLEVPAVLSGADGLLFRLDTLGAFFLGLVGLVAIPCGIYGAAYSEAYEGRYSLRLLGAMLNLFLLTMSLVPCAGNVLTFLLMWEGMSLTSYFLVLTEADEPDTVLAGSARPGAAGGWSRRRGWSTRRPLLPSPCAACSPSCTGRPRTSRSTSIPNRSTSCSRSSTGARSSPGSSATSTRRSSAASGGGHPGPGDSVRLGPCLSRVSRDRPRGAPDPAPRAADVR